MWNSVPEYYMHKILLYTFHYTQLKFSVLHLIQRICPGYLMLVRQTWIFSSLSSRFPQSLLDEPNPNSPANSQAAQLYQENKREYEKRVTAIVEQSWVDVWAAPRSLLLPLHHPLLIIPSYSSLSFLPHQEKKNSNYIRRTQVPPWKKRKNIY